MFKLLIVDDEAIEREALKYIIHQSALEFEEIREASNGQDAISEAAIFEPDIIVMDIKMPGLGGLEASKIIKKIKANTRIILLTAFDEFNYAHEGIKIGVEDFLVKPASNERILSVLEKSMHSIEADRVDQRKKVAMEGKLMQVSKYLETEFLTSIISGDIELEQSKEYLEFLKINSENGFGIAIILSYDSVKNPSNLQRQILKKRIFEKLEKDMAGLQAQFFMTYIKETIYILVIHADTSHLYNVQNTVRDVIVSNANHALESYEVYIDFGIGDIKHRFVDMWQSFSEAKTACHKKTYTKRENEHYEIIQKIMRCVIGGEVELFDQCLDVLFEDIVAKTSDIQSIKIKLYETVVLFNQSIYENMPILFEESGQIFNEIMAVSTLGESKIFLKSYMMSVLQKILNHKMDKTMMIMDKLITYMNSHYRENITLEQLSAMSGFSLHYLSKVFKKHVDMNFSDYLSYIRIIAAKRQLKNPEKSVKEISIEVGYSDPNYFARVFKKYEHITPSEFRQKNLGL